MIQQFPAATTVVVGAGIGVCFEAANTPLLTRAETKVPNRCAGYLCSLKTLPCTEA